MHVNSIKITYTIFANEFNITFMYITNSHIPKQKIKTFFLSDNVGSLGLE